MKSKMDSALITLSVIAAVISAYVSLAQADIFGLAGTQWMLVALVLGVYGIYAKMRAV